MIRNWAQHRVGTTFLRECCTRSREADEHPALTQARHPRVPALDLRGANSNSSTSSATTLDPNSTAASEPSSSPASAYQTLQVEWYSPGESTARGTAQSARRDGSGGDSNVVELLSSARTEDAVEAEEAGQQEVNDGFLRLVDQNRAALVQEYLLARRPSPDILGTALMRASYSGDLTMAFLLLRSNAPVDMEDGEGNCALHWAAAHAARNPMAVTLAASLLSNGARVNHENVHLGTPLLTAAHNGCSELVQILLAKLAEVDRTTSTGVTPLLLAAKEGWHAVARQLLEAQANVNHAQREEWTPLMMAASNGRTDVLHLLLAHSADVNRTEQHRVSALVLASARRHVAAVGTLLRARADVNARDARGTTAILPAALFGDCEVVQMLLQARANPELCDARGRNALAGAQTAGHQQVVNLLQHHWRTSISDA